MGPKSTRRCTARAPAELELQHVDDGPGTEDALGYARDGLIKNVPLVEESDVVREDAIWP